MALIRCETCGRDVSDEAKTCPHCGAKTPSTIAKQKARKRILWIVGLIVGIIVVCGLVFGVIIPKLKNIDEEKTKETEYQKAISLYEEGEYEEALKAFLKMTGYKDSDKWIIDCNNEILVEQYRKAKKLFNDGEYDAAYNEFEQLNGYEDSNKYMAKILLAKLEPGQEYVFGVYEQDGNTTNGAEPLTWIVLGSEDGRVLLLSKYILEWRQFHNRNEAATWNSCSLRSWLNDEFYKKAFGAEEQSIILASDVSADANPKFKSTTQGVKTTDKIFIMSANQVNQYSKYSLTKCDCTTYALKQREAAFGYAVSSAIELTDYNASVEKKSHQWWTRTMGKSKNDVVTVHVDRYENDDAIFYSGYDAFGYYWTPNKSTPKYSGVRPVIWIGYED